MRRVALPIEDPRLRSGECLGSESQLDERPNALCQQIVVEPIDPGPVVYNSAVDDPYGAQHVVKNAVEAHVAETELIDRRPQLRLTVGPDQRARIIGADR